MPPRPPIDLEATADRAWLAAFVRDLGSTADRDARWLRAPESPPRWAALLPGTFNPPTAAHLALGAEARRAGADLVIYILAVQSVDKEQLVEMRLEDRIGLMDQIAARTGAALVVTNRGLYVDIAIALRGLLPACRLSFVLGYDKLVQILDPRYYQDREAVLRDLFTLADLLVSPRGDQGEEDIATLMDRPENRRYRDRIAVLPASEQLDLNQSSSAIRARADDLDTVPPEARVFIERWDPYGWRDDHYTRR